MKTRIALCFAVLCMAVINGCSDPKTYTYTQWVPVYISMAEFRSGVKVAEARPLKKPGKIYVKGNYLFINEQEKGIHLFDNSNPRAPKNLLFIAIPGNGDLAVKGDILYADSYIDLVALDISNLNNIRVVKRVQSIFPSYRYANGMRVDTTKGIAIDWKQETVTVEYSDSPTQFDGRTTTNQPTGGMSGGGGSSSGSSSSGIGGSMARFTIYDRTLYAVSTTDLQMFIIDNPANPVVWAKMNLGRNIETIFPYKDKLFIGTQQGMFIYDNKSQRNPVRLCEFRHARSCDPVVVEGNYAYVTLRSGTQCAGTQNQLDIVDITDLMNPKLLKSYPMQEPFGVGIDGTTLFVCDGIAGLKVFDASNYSDIQLQSFMPDFRTYDIIPLGKNAIVIGADGLYQYDYTNPADMTLLSKVSVEK